MKQDVEQKKLRSELAKDHEKEERDEDKRRHKEFIEALEDIKKRSQKVEKPKVEKKPTKDKKDKKELDDASKEAKAATQKAETKASETKTTAPKATKETSKPETTPKTTAVKEAPSRGVSTAVKAGVGVAVVAGTSSVIAKIKGHEGYQEKAYYDPKRDENGKVLEERYSVGYGHQITPAEVNRGYILAGDKKINVSGDLGKDTKISKSDAEELLKQDYKPYENAARQIPNFEKLNESAQAALIDMTYNMGVGWYYDAKGKPNWPRLHKALSDLDLNAAANSIIDSKYYKDTGKRAQENVELIRSGLDNKQKNMTIQNDIGQKMDSVSKQNMDTKKQSSSTVIVNNSKTMVAVTPQTQPISITSTSDIRPQY
jgi:GH24 family phage-related lysozyme (muramidase)